MDSATALQRTGSAQRHFHNMKSGVIPDPTYRDEGTDEEEEEEEANPDVPHSSRASIDRVSRPKKSASNRSSLLHDSDADRYRSRSEWDKPRRVTGDAGRTKKFKAPEEFVNDATLRQAIFDHKLPSPRTLPEPSRTVRKELQKRESPSRIIYHASAECTSLDLNKLEGNRVVEILFWEAVEPVTKLPFSPKIICM